MSSVRGRDPELTEQQDTPFSRAGAPLRAPVTRVQEFARQQWGWVALLALLIGGGALALAQTHGTVFADDEWVWILQRRGGGLGTYLQPHNSHLSLVPIAIYKLLFATVGIRHYWPYRLVVTVAHLAVVVLVFVYVRRRVGSWIALLAAALLVFFGPGWQDFLWPFQMAWLIALGAGVAALLALDRRDRAGDVAACLLLIVSLASAGPGLAVAAGVVVEIALRRAWNRLWVVGVPLVLYGLWWVGYQHTNISHDSVFYLTRFVVDAAAGVFSSLAGLSGSDAVTNSGDFVTWGAPLVLLAAVALSWRLRHSHPMPVRILTLIVMLVTFWVLTAIGRAYVTLGSAVLTSTGDESRYLYVGAVLVLLLGAEAMRGVRFSLPVQMLASVAVVLAVISNVQALRYGAQSLRTQAAQAVAELGTLDMTRPFVSPDYVSQGFIFGIVKAGPYFEAEAALGTPAANPAQIATESEAARVAADSQLIAIHHVTLPVLPAPFARGVGAPPVPNVIQNGTVSARGPCLRFTPAAFTQTGTVAELELTLPRAGLVLKAAGAAATVQLRRFALAANTIGVLQPGQSVLLRIGPDLSSQPWHVRLLPAALASVCSLR